MENSKIEWTHHTFNPWIGCVKVSEGCKNCYAEALDKRWGRDNWGANASRTRTSDAYWKNPIKWNRQAEKEGKRLRVFCASLADVFEDNEKLIEWRMELFMLITLTPHLDWLLLTKRPENVMKMIPADWHPKDYGDDQPIRRVFPKNVWIGTTVENQEQADLRIPELLRIPARVRFLSCEPLLGPVVLKNYLPDHSASLVKGDAPTLRGIQWVIVGGESGHGARPMHPDWVTRIGGQCAGHSIPFLFKQWGEYAPLKATSNDWAEYRDDGDKYLTQQDGVVPVKWFGEKFTKEATIVYRVGKKKAGRLLDGVEYTAFPSALKESVC